MIKDFMVWLTILAAAYGLACSMAAHYVSGRRLRSSLVSQGAVVSAKGKPSNQAYPSLELCRYLLRYDTIFRLSELKLRTVKKRIH